MHRHIVLNLIFQLTSFQKQFSILKYIFMRFFFSSKQSNYILLHLCFNLFFQQQQLSFQPELLPLLHLVIWIQYFFIYTTFCWLNEMWLKAFISTYFFMCSESNIYDHKKEKTVIFGLKKDNKFERIFSFSFSGVVAIWYQLFKSVFDHWNPDDDLFILVSYKSSGSHVNFKLNFEFHFH